MLNILGSPKISCDGFTRRDLLQVGSLGIGGLSLAGLLEREKSLLARESHSTSSSFGQAKHCVLLYLFGAASQLETFDVKPEAPLEVRGELGTLSTSLPDLRICDHLPEFAKIADRVTVVRSTTHPYPIHGSAFSITSTPTLDIPMQLNARDQRHWPFIGSAVDFLDQHQRGEKTLGTGFRNDVPWNIALPWKLSSRRPHPSRNGGPYGAFLGSNFDPVWTEFTGTALNEASYEFGGKITTVRDPYGGIEPDCQFSFSAQNESGIAIDGLSRRRSLLEQLGVARRHFDSNGAVETFNHFQQMAFSLLTSQAASEALDVSRESTAMRKKYGMNLFGQSCLIARRLVEAGSRFVTVFWDEYGSVNAAWDTHIQHYPRMKNQLLPGFDRALSGLIMDLEDRGLLDETLIVCVTEHGRTPKIRNAKGGGRDHWSNAYCSLLAGGGAACGRVVGRTDEIAGEVVDSPVSPKDILATMYHLLGIDPETIIHDQLGRPVPVGGVGHIRPELL